MVVGLGCLALVLGIVRVLAITILYRYVVVVLGIVRVLAITILYRYDVVVLGIVRVLVGLLSSASTDIAKAAALALECS